MDLANDYEAVRELVHETLHAQIGMRRERVTTFGHIEEWTPADLERYRRLGLPKLLEAGHKNDLPGQSFREQHEHLGREQFLCHGGLQSRRFGRRGKASRFLRRRASRGRDGADVGEIRRSRL